MRPWIVIAVCSLALWGCGSRSSDNKIEGTYVGKLVLAEGKTEADLQPSEQASFYQAQATTGQSITVELKDGGKAVFTASQPIEGTWTESGGQITLTLPPASGKGFGGTYTLQVAGVGQIFGPDPNVANVSMRLFRRAAKDKG